MLTCVGAGGARGRESLGHAVGATEGVGPQVGVVLRPERKQLAVIAVRRLDVLHLAATVDGGGEFLLAQSVPADGAVETALASAAAMTVSG